MANPCHSHKLLLSRFSKKFENKDVFLPVGQSELVALLPRGFLRRKIISGQSLNEGHPIVLNTATDTDGHVVLGHDFPLAKLTSSRKSWINCSTLPYSTVSAGFVFWCGKPAIGPMTCRSRSNVTSLCIYSAISSASDRSAWTWVRS